MDLGKRRFSHRFMKATWRISFKNFRRNEAGRFFPVRPSCRHYALASEGCAWGMQQLIRIRSFAFYWYRQRLFSIMAANP